MVAMKNLIFSCVLLAIPYFVLAETPTLTAEINSAKILTTSEKGSEIQLEVRQLTLAKVLDELAEKTKIPIHYSILPEGFITATCVGSSIKPVLECLFDHKADIIVRYVRTKSPVTSNKRIAEAWVLGAKLEATSARGNNCPKADEKEALTVWNKTLESEPKLNQSDELLKLARTGNSNTRVEAIGALLSIGRTNDPKIKAMLEEAIHDQDASVRAQAVSTLTLRDDYRENAADIILEALRDDSSEVRMMAVEGIKDEVGLLEQAVNDNDEVIRTLAASKLEELLAQQQRKSGR